MSNQNQKTPVLKADSITMRFGGLCAVDSFRLELYENQLHGLIGPNGAGKTTIFNMITGNYTPTVGKVYLDGKDITSLRPSSINQKGLARTFQNIRLFKDLSVLDNVKLACHFRINYGFAHGIFRTPKFVQEEKRILDEAMDLLKLFKLDHKAGLLAKNLPYGEQRRLEMARAMATQPKVILLDEPAAGMNPQETKELTDLIAFIREQYKMAILLIEHDMKLVMRICEKIIVVDHGVLIAEGSAGEIQKNDKVIEAYLGASH